jgi:hypothetical protein
MRRLQNPILQKIRPYSLAFNIAQNGNGVLADVIDARTSATIRYESEQVIFCGPRFVAHHVVNELRNTPCPVRHYAPWMVANLTLKRMPFGPGAEIAWDNVFYDSPSLGYVVATHQNPSRKVGKTVITYYSALCDKTPVEARQDAQNRSYEDWCAMILADLEKVHPGIRDDIENLDVWIWGHGMAAPTVGFIWGASQRAMPAKLGRIHFAHSDMSGISLFEEAYIRGQRAADDVLAQLT